MKLEQIIGGVIKFMSMLLLILAPIHSVLIAVSVLVFADLITGVWASKKEGQRITSHGLRRSIAKTLAYQGSIIVAFIIETWLLAGVPVVKVVAGLIAVTEGQSFFENLNRITGIDFWSAILSKIQGSSTKVFPDKK